MLQKILQKTNLINKFLVDIEQSRRSRLELDGTRRRKSATGYRTCLERASQVDKNVYFCPFTLDID